MQAITNAPFPDRIQILCAPFIGPFAQDGPLGDFDPRRDLKVFVDGVQIAVRSFAFDTDNNRYLLYMDTSFNLQGVIQIVHHVPSPPFVAQVNPPLFDLTPGDEPGEDGGGS
jgi:hypothetical protein